MSGSLAWEGVSRLTCRFGHEAGEALLVGHVTALLDQHGGDAAPPVFLVHVEQLEIKELGGRGIKISTKY